MSGEDWARLRDLRRRELNNESLSESEAVELAELYALQEREETALLAPAIGKIQAETDALVQENAALRNLLEREKSFASRLETVLAEVAQERQALQAERKRLAGALGRAA